jgi:hypothetical protein
MKLLFTVTLLFLLIMLATDGTLQIKTKLFTWNWSAESFKNSIVKLFSKLKK